jgi:hypothetical protein
VCPGLAIFVVKKQGEQGLLTLPYEFLPVPEKGDVVDTIDRDGETVGEGLVKRVSKQGKTMVVTIQLDAKDLMIVRHIRMRDNGD